MGIAIPDTIVKSARRATGAVCTHTKHLCLHLIKDMGVAGLADNSIESDKTELKRSRQDY